MVVGDTSGLQNNSVCDICFRLSRTFGPDTHKVNRRYKSIEPYQVEHG